MIKLQHCFKSDSDFADWVDFAYWESFIGEGLPTYTQPRKQACLQKYRIDVIIVVYSKLQTSRYQ